MKSSFIAFVISSLWFVQGSNITDGKNKIKRNLSGDIQNYGETNLVWLSSDKHPSVVRNTNTYYSNNARPVALVGVHSPLRVYEPKVTADQVQYEFEQAPTNPATNPHLKQLFQPANNFNQELAGQTYKPFLQNNSPNDASSNNFNQELAGQTYKSFLQNNAPNVASFNNFNPELAGQTYKPFLQSNNPNVVRSNNYNQELIGQTYKPFLQTNSPNVVGSETIVTPVQHSHLIQNNIHPVHPYTNIRVHPLYNVQPQYTGSKKYLYVNGKIIVDPNTFQNQNPPTFYHSSQQFPQRQQIINHVNHNGVPRQSLVPPSANQPIPHNRFQPPPQSQILPIDTPSTAPPKTERQQKPPRQRGEEKPVEEDNDEEDNEEYRQHDEDDSDNYEGPDHEKYSFEDDDEDDHQSFREHEDIEEDDEEDSNGGSTRFISSKVNKYPKKFNKPGKRDEIIYGSRYEYPEKKYSKESGKKRRMKFKSYKYSKDSDQYPREGIEGRQSQYVPVTHKQKIFKEKWYLSKSSADREQFDE